MAEILVQVCQKVCGDFELAAVVRSAAEVAAVAVNAESCSILLQARDPDTGELCLDVPGGVDGDSRDVRLPVDKETIAGWVAEGGKALLIPDVRRDGRFGPACDAGCAFPVQSAICVPLRVNEKQLGVVQLLNRRDGKSFDAQDLELSKAVASLIARAIDRGWEYDARLRAERLATVGRTIAEAAHFIKNILNGLQSGAYIIDQSLQGDRNSAAMRGWRTVKRNMHLLGKIVQDMLSYSKQRMPARQPCSVADVCRDVVGLLREQAREKSVKLVCEPSGDFSDVWIDEGAIRRCLINLVSNAIDACEEKGGTAELEVSPADASGYFAIRVRDDGCGIDPAMRERIFEPFFSTKGGEGTGLGLAVVKKIVEEHGGTIEVESSPEGGTEFALVLPVQRPKEDAER